MAMVAFLRGVNVGGHRAFRPNLLARELCRFVVINIGAAGTLVVRRPVSRSVFRAALMRALPFEAEVMMCAGRDILQLEHPHPVSASDKGLVRFVSILATASPALPGLPLALPANGEGLVRLLASQGRFVFGVYRRDMKTIGQLGKLDGYLGARATTRNWNTMVAVQKALSGGK